MENEEKERIKNELSAFKESLRERIEDLKEAGKIEAEQIREDEEIKAALLGISGENQKAAQRALNDELNNLQKEQTDFITENIKALGQTEAQELLNRQNAFSNFLSERLNAQVLANEEENLSNEERLAYLEKQRNLLLEQFTGNKEAQLAIQKAYDNMLLAEEKRVTETQRKLLEERLGAFSTFFNGFSSLLALAGEKNEAAAIASKALASAEAAINSYLAFTKALASAAPPFNYVMAAGVLATGLAQQIKIISTPIPSAETGGRFIVPHSVGSDSTLMKVNSDEEVEVTPRGMSGFNRAQNITVQMDKQVLFDVMNEGIRSGDVIISAANF
jgi:hypothetical protein